MKRLLKDGAIFLLFGAIYFSLEFIWKGYFPHWTMFVLGGCMGMCIGGLNEYLPWEWSFWKQCTCGMVLVTVAEGISGLVLNRLLGLAIWNYSNVWGNFFFHQCCIPFSIIWFFLSGLCILIDDQVRYVFFSEEKPYYNFSKW